MLRFKVVGMTCGHCVRAVEQAVHGVAPGASVSVDLGKGEVVVNGPASAEQVRGAIVDAGYEAALEAA